MGFSEFLEMTTKMWMVLSLLSASTLLADDRDLEAQRRFDALHDTAAETEPLPPASLGAVLDPEFTRLGEDIKPHATADWKRRLEERDGRASLVPLSPLDPRRDLLILVPGNGMNFQDTHVQVQLEDTYQVLIAISNHRRPITENGRHLADAVVEMMAYRDALARRKGITPSRSLRLIGHSFGGVTAPMMLGELVERGLLDDSEESLFSSVLYVAMDAPWRGLDLPFPVRLPGIRHLGSWLLGRIFPRANPGNFSLANNSKAMKELQGLVFPANVAIHHVTVLGPQETSARYRHLEPVANWYSVELGQGELERLWEFHRQEMSTLGSLDSWGAWLTRRKGLAHLVLALARDADYPAIAPRLAEAARQARSAEEFAAAYDKLLAGVVDTFEGQHTQFMWTEPRFLPWLRAKLAPRGSAGP